MPCTTTTRWTVPASKETDISLRCFLAELGMQKGDISKFIGDAVKWRMFDQTLDETRKQVEDVPEAEMQAIINEACESVRSEIRQELLDI